MFKDFAQEKLMKELRDLNTVKKKSVNKQELFKYISKMEMGDKLKQFDHKELNPELINFYICDEEEVKRRISQPKQPNLDEDENEEFDSMHTQSR